MNQLTKAGEPICKYRFYARLCVDRAWRVPVLHGKLSGVPDAAAVPYQKGMYALSLMLLFRPHRRIFDVFPSNLRENELNMTEDEAWISIYDEFIRWRRDDIDAIAEEFTQRMKQMSTPTPAFDSEAWWSLVIYEKLRNYDIVMRRHLGEESLKPLVLNDLPPYHGPDDFNNRDDDAPRPDEDKDDAS